MEKNESLDSPEIISRYAFGVDPGKIGEISLLLKVDRVEQFKSTFDKLLYELKGGVFNGLTGIISGREISVIYSKGPACIADCVAFLGMAKTKCHTIISTGSVGGLDEQINIGDLVIANETIANDGYSLFEARKEGTFQTGFFENIVKPRGDIINLIEDSVKEEAKKIKVRYHKGKLFTIPGVSLESEEFLKEILSNNCISIDMGSSQFYTACQKYNFNSAVISWVTDLPLTKSYFYNLKVNPKFIKDDIEKKHQIWLNMPKIITDILRSYIKKINT